LTARNLRKALAARWSGWPAGSPNVGVPALDLDCLALSRVPSYLIKRKSLFVTWKLIRVTLPKDGDRAGAQQVGSLPLRGL
jgi:hypothetical protein